MRPAANPAAPGSTLLHPIAIGALALLLVNDHVLKAAAPGWITGKLSDVAGLALTPIVVVALWQLAAARLPWPGARRPSVDVVSAAAVAASVVAVAFALVKLSPLANDVYSVVIGPTRLDSGDLVALPAVALGWWVAAHCGERSPEPHDREPRATRRRLQVVGRAGALSLAVFAIAATSPAQPTKEATTVEPDEVLLAPGERVDRFATVTVIRVGPESSIVIEARSRWPFVDPAPRFEVIREGDEPVPGGSSQTWVDPASCLDGCNVRVAIAITLPAPPDRGATSIAWELVSTVRAGPTEGFSGGDIVTIAGQGFASRQHVLAPWVSIPFALVLAALLFAVGGIPSRVARRGVRTRDDALVLTASSVVAAVFVTAAIVLPQSTFAPAAGGVGRFALIMSLVAGCSVVAGTILWWRGTGAALAIVLVSIALVGLSLAARLIDDSSATFARAGLLATLALTIIGTIALVGALRRPGRIGGAWIAPSRIVVAAVGSATAIGLIVVTGLDTLTTETVPATGAIHAAAVAIWWKGNGMFLGLTSFAIGAATVLRAAAGSVSFSTKPVADEWTVFTMVAVLAGTGVTLLAAFDQFASFPRRPIPTDLAESAAPAPATDAVPPS